MTATGDLIRTDALVKTFASPRHLRGGARTLTAVDHVSIAIRPGETFGLVGESGSGKSTLARCILRLTEPTSGEVHFRGTPLGSLGANALRDLRQEMQIVFQDPFASLDPRMTARQSVEEPLAIHDVGDRAGRRARAMEMLDLVGLPAGSHERRPHEFSGGQRQRIAIARALALEPVFVALDEPVTALDVSVQAQVLNLLRTLQAELGLTYLFVVHDLVLAEYFCDRLAVMYAGAIVELGSRSAIFREPMHPYSTVLLEAAPDPTPRRGAPRERRTVVVGDGELPSSGCPFRPRCPVGRDRELCASTRPALTEHASGHFAACHFPDEAASLPRRDGSRPGAASSVR